MAERLAYILKKRDKTAADLARATKKTESAVSQWLSGETKSMRSDSLMASCALLSCNPQWLASGQGPMEPGTATANITLPGITVTASGSNQAPALMGRADAAINTEASQQQAVDLISSVMDMMDDAQREAMAGKLASWARAPDSPKIKKSIAESLAFLSQMIYYRVYDCTRHRYTNRHACLATSVLGAG